VQSPPPRRNRLAFKGLATLLAGLGLLPLAWLGIASGDWSVARVTLIDPLVVAALCVATGMLAPRATRTLFSRVSTAVRRVPAAVLLGAVAIVLVAAGVLVARYTYNGQPALTDELSQAFQGRILRGGRLAAVPEAYREFFDTAQTLMRDGRWFSEYPIGSGALAAIGEWARAGIFINPIMLALAAIATWSFARRAYDETTARVALILVALSPFAIFLSATRMNHVPALTLTAATLAALAQWTQAESSPARFAWAGAVGAALGAMVLFRPYDAVLVAAPIAVFQVAAILRERGRAPSLVAQVAAGALITGVQLWVNARTTGSATLFGYDALNGIAHRPGFHADPLGAAFTPSRGFEFVLLYLQGLDTSLFESAIPGVAFVVLGMWLGSGDRWDWLLAGIILSFLGGYGMYWARGTFSGPRFLYPSLVAYVVFAARFMVLAVRRDRPWATGAALTLPVCIALALLPPALGSRSTGTWLRFSQMRAQPASRTENPAAEARAAGLKNALVLVREPLHARITARLRALGMKPFDAEVAAADLDACALLAALAASDAAPGVDAGVRLQGVLAKARAAGAATPVPGLFASTALALIGGRPSDDACRREVEVDRDGTFFFGRFLAAATFDSLGRLGGDVVYARTLGARDSILLTTRFATRDWYVYRRSDSVNSGRFELVRPAESNGSRGQGR
jgi:hypothetical protein